MELIIMKRITQDAEYMNCTAHTNIYIILFIGGNDHIIYGISSLPCSLSSLPRSNSRNSSAHKGTKEKGRIGTFFFFVVGYVME